MQRLKRLVLLRTTQHNPTHDTTQHSTAQRTLSTQRSALQCWGPAHALPSPAPHSYLQSVSQRLSAVCAAPIPIDPESVKRVVVLRTTQHRTTHHHTTSQRIAQNMQLPLSGRSAVHSLCRWLRVCHHTTEAVERAYHQSVRHRLSAGCTDLIPFEVQRVQSVVVLRADAHTDHSTAQHSTEMR